MIKKIIKKAKDLEESIGTRAIDNYVKKITLGDAKKGKYNKDINSFEDNKNLIGKSKLNSVNELMGEKTSNDLISQLKTLIGGSIFLGVIFYIILAIGYILTSKYIFYNNTTSYFFLWLFLVTLLLVYIIQVIFFRVNYKNYVIQRYYDVTNMGKYINNKFKDSLYLDFDKKSDTYLRMYSGIYSTKTGIYIIKDKKIIEIEHKKGLLRVLVFYKNSLGRFYTDFKVLNMLAIKGSNK